MSRTVAVSGQTASILNCDSCGVTLRIDEAAQIADDRLNENEQAPTLCEDCAEYEQKYK